MSISTFIKNISMAAVGVALALGTGEVARASTLIDTTTSWRGSSIRPFGERNTATYGQTFTVENDNILDSFTFFLNDYKYHRHYNPDTVDFAAYIMEWDGDKATGDILYDSGKQSTNRRRGFEEFTFDTEGIVLEEDRQYVAFLSASNFFDHKPGKSRMGYIWHDVYEGGEFVYFNNGSHFNKLTTHSWNKRFAHGDAAFKASFSSSEAKSVPEPTSMLGLLAVGAFAASSLLKRDRKQQA